MSLRQSLGWSSLALIAATWASTWTTSAFALTDTNWINQRLREFSDDPKAFITSDERNQKYDPDTLQPIEQDSILHLKGLDPEKILDMKDRVRATLLGVNQRDGRAPIYKNDDPRNLVDDFRYTQLSGMEAASLRSSTLDVSPWSDDYWPIVTGSIAKRYSDPQFPNSRDWSVNMNYITRSTCSIASLSPAEKYDLLVGDPYRTLTRSMLAEGKSYFDASGVVESWMGICHGWAQASYMLPRPQRAIEMIASDGRTRIPFYPADLKALASLLWAKAAPVSKLIGGRCNQKQPAEDRYGRIIAQDCFDTNPGTWHLALVNQIGHSRRSFVFDATYDYEVWNQPVLSYEYSYFNPSTRQAVATLNQATVLRSRFRNDVFYRYRSPEAAYIVGIVMKVIYIAEVKPKALLNDTPQQDRRVAVNYIYDLELDRYGNILGGEWYQRKHPDFLWSPPKDARAVTAGDQYLTRFEGWNGYSPLPVSWQKAAHLASKEGQPLAGIVETLLQLSQLSGG